MTEVGVLNPFEELSRSKGGETWHRTFETSQSFNPVKIPREVNKG